MADNAIAKKSFGEKINAVKLGINAKATGNAMNRYTYFELSDIVVQISTLEDKYGLYSLFHCEEGNPWKASLTVYDCDSDKSHTITLPMVEAGVKMASPIQNMGAAVTYCRRYLYMAMYNIAEADIVEQAEKVIDYSRDPRNGKPFSKMNLQQLIAIRDGMTNSDTPDKYVGYLKEVNQLILALEQSQEVKPQAININEV